MKMSTVLNAGYDTACYKEYIPKCIEDVFSHWEYPPSIIIDNGFDFGGNVDSIYIEISMPDDTETIFFYEAMNLVEAYFMGIIRAITD